MVYPVSAFPEAFFGGAEERGKEEGKGALSAITTKEKRKTLTNWMVYQFRGRRGKRGEIFLVNILFSLHSIAKGQKGGEILLGIFLTDCSGRKGRKKEGLRIRYFSLGKRRKKGRSRFRFSVPWLSSEGEEGEGGKCTAFRPLLPNLS